MWINDKVRGKWLIWCRLVERKTLLEWSLRFHLYAYINAQKYRHIYCLLDLNVGMLAVWKWFRHSRVIWFRNWKYATFLKIELNVDAVKTHKGRINLVQQSNSVETTRKRNSTSWSAGHVNRTKECINTLSQTERRIYNKRLFYVLF